MQVAVQSVQTLSGEEERDRERVPSTDLPLFLVFFFDLPSKLSKLQMYMYMYNVRKYITVIKNVVAVCKNYIVLFEITKYIFALHPSRSKEEDFEKRKAVERDVMRRKEKKRKIMKKGRNKGRNVLAVAQRTCSSPG